MGDVFKLFAFPAGDSADQIVEQALPWARVLDQGGGHGGSASGAAIQNEVLVFFQFPETVFNFRQGNELGARNMAFGIFDGLTHIDQKIIALPGLGPEFFQLVRKDIDHVSVHFLPHVARGWLDPLHVRERPS